MVVEGEVDRDSLIAPLLRNGEAKVVLSIKYIRIEGISLA
jgi:hypothetical protein